MATFQISLTENFNFIMSEMDQTFLTVYTNVRFMQQSRAQQAYTTGYLAKDILMSFRLLKQTEKV